MKLKEKILNLLNEKETEFISGQYLAETFNVSRNAVWKAVNSLRQDGYNIYAVQNKGYTLDGEGIFTGEIIQSYIHSPVKIEYIPNVTSTNDIIMEYGRQGIEEFITVVADSQSSGRGRKGRIFYSPDNAGTYFSILLRPNINFSESLYITTAAAAAVTEAMKQLYNMDTEIKWVNDIYYKGKKICGILTEAHIDMESGTVDYAALGIGINVFEPEKSFHKDIKNIAGAAFCRSMFDNKIRCEITAKVIDIFYEYYKNLSDMTFLNTYKARSFLTGKNVTIEKNGIVQKAFVKGIDDKCRLSVMLENGIEENLNSCEVNLSL